MARNTFFTSIVLCLLCVGLSQVSDPGVFGLREEPLRIMFYGGSGLLAGLSGIVAVVSGLYLAATLFEGFSDHQMRLMWAMVFIVMIAVVVRFNPS